MKVGEIWNPKSPEYGRIRLYRYLPKEESYQCESQLPNGEWTIIDWGYCVRTCKEIFDRYEKDYNESR